MKEGNNTINQKELFREYSSPRGMSLTGNACPEKRFSYLKNMYVDYEGGGDSIESIPGYRRIYSSKKDVGLLGVHRARGKSWLVFREDHTLCRLEYPSGRMEKIADLYGEASAFVLGEICLVTDERGLYSIDSEGDVRTLCEEEYIVGCRTAALFDGRLFLSGNERHRGKIFYSTRLDESELHFSKDSFIKARGEVSSLLTHRGTLFVFSSDGGEGVISSHKADGGYPVCLNLGGAIPTGEVLSLNDEILFLTGEGLFAIESPIKEEARLVCRSREIEPMLLREDIPSAKLGFWRGYAVIGCGKSIYLGDTRSADRNYDWYFITDVGAYCGDKRVYRYSPSADEGCLAHKLTHGIAEGEIISRMLETGSTIYYTEENGKKYSVYPTDERMGGSLIPAENLLSDGELLCFSADGSILIFNNDMRGVAGDEIVNLPWYDPEEYEKLYGNKIRPELYSFDGHAPHYVISTAYDCCGLPINEKTSIGESLFLKIKSPVKAALTVVVNTDKGKTTRQTVTALPHFSDGYGYKNQTCIVRATERAHGWLEKQIILEGNEFCSPFGLCSIAFKYQPKEKTKKG